MKFAIAVIVVIMVFAAEFTGYKCGWDAAMKCCTEQMQQDAQDRDRTIDLYKIRFVK